MSEVSTQDSGIDAAIAYSVALFTQQIDAQRDAIMKVMAPGVKWETFRATVLIAVTRKPEVLKTNIDRNSLFLACQDAARAGLLPDGKEGAIVVRYNSERKRDEAVFQAMIAGMRKAAYRTGRVLSMQAHIVYEGEDFRIVLGDDERIEHTRSIEAMDAGLDHMVAAYCVVHMADGSKIRRHMSAKRILAVRDACKSWSGPWGKKTGGKGEPVKWVSWGPFADEMVVKTLLLYTLKAVDLTSPGMEQFSGLVDQQRTIESLDVLGDEPAEPPAATPLLTAEAHLDALELAMGPAQEREPVPAAHAPVNRTVALVRNEKPADKPRRDRRSSDKTTEPSDHDQVPDMVPAASAQPPAQDEPPPPEPDSYGQDNSGPGVELPPAITLDDAHAFMDRIKSRLAPNPMYSPRQVVEKMRISPGNVRYMTSIRHYYPALYTMIDDAMEAHALGL